MIAKSLITFSFIFQPGSFNESDQMNGSNYNFHFLLSEDCLFEPGRPLTDFETVREVNVQEIQRLMQLENPVRRY